MSELINSLLIELRPRLQSCNVFLKPLNGLNIDSTTFKIKLRSNSILFLYKNPSSNYQICETIEIDKKYQLLPKSMSSLTVDNKFVSFRVTTKTLNQFGSFKTEILQMNDATKLPVAIPPCQFESIKLAEHSLECRNCTNKLLNASIQFRRILPLPSENCNPNDWFCHKSETKNVSSSLQPKFDELFYNFCSFTINSIILNEKAMYFDKVVFCKRCLAWLGTNIEGQIFLWDCTVQFVKNIETRLNSIQITDVNLNLNAVHQSILNLINETIGIVCKILIECQVTVDKTEYILLWVLDRRLDVALFENSPHKHVEHKRLRLIQLQNYIAIKLLFKYCTNVSSDVQLWQSDMNVQNLKVAYPMFKDGLKDLNDKAELMSNYSNASDDFTISYIILE